MYYPTLREDLTSIKLFVGIDVDDTAFHGYAIASDENEGVEFKTRPSASSLIKTLKKIRRAEHQMRVCYEAGYLGYSLQRELKKHGILCEVIAPTLIPKPAGKTVKTDRIDARSLAIYYKKGLLIPVHIPTQTQEALRDLLRSRHFVKKQTVRIRHHLLSHTRRMGLHYRQETNNPDGAYWTKKHLSWLNTRMGHKYAPGIEIKLSLLLKRLESLNNEADTYDDEIRKISQASEYKDSIQALVCYRGINVLSAATLVTEIGDIRRFAHPRYLTSYCGMDIREYSSGGKEKKFHMSRFGNRYIRTTVVEACQCVASAPLISQSLKQRRQNAPKEFIDIADRCMQRLHKKARHLLYKSKPKNKVKAACARELLGFIWESLMLASKVPPIYKT